MPATTPSAVSIGLAATPMERASTSRPSTRLDARPLSVPTVSLNSVFPTLTMATATMLDLVEAVWCEAK